MKEYFEQAYQIDKRIEAKLEFISSLRELATKSTAALGGETVSHTRNVHSAQDVIARIADLTDEVLRDMNELVDLKAEIYKVIERVPDPRCQAILELRYLAYDSWDDISKLLQLSPERVFKLHSKALQSAEALVREHG